MDQNLEYGEKELKLFRIWAKATKALFDNVAKDITAHGLTLENFMVMELLYSKGAHYIQEISEKLDIPSGSITYVVNKLEKKEYVRREIDDENKRYIKVILTKKGQDLFHDIFPKHVKMIVDNMAVLDDAQKEQLSTLLKSIGLAAEELKA
jgi:MarR family transcriptional regulator, 2-MHQ and catechol-resistance regulon repressor